MFTLAQNVSLATGVLALCLGLYSLWQISSINRLRKTFFAGRSGADMEGIILSLKEQLQDSQRQQATLEQSLKNTRDILSFAVQKVGLVRFNPFQDGGGNFSFSLALLDSRDNGVIITSMYGREQNRIYTKRILAGGSDAPLTKEETEAVAFANSKNQEPRAKKISNRKT